MKKLFSYIHILLLVLGTTLLASCDDNLFSSQGGYDGKVGLKLALSLPDGGAATRAGGTGATTGTQPGTAYENLIERTDIRLLIFKEKVFKEEVSQLKISGSDATYYLEGVTASDYEGTIETVVFANAGNRGVSPAKEAFNGKTLEEVYQLFKFTYGEKTGWTVDEKHRIPMWGSTTLTVIKGQQNSGNVNMHRAIAKVGFTVGGGEGLDNFTLKSVRMYFSNTEGYCAPMPDNIPSVGTEITTPSIPATSTQMGVSNPLTYTVEDGANCYEDRIYLPEAANKQPGNGNQPVCIVVGGYYAGAGLVTEGTQKESYYRIDFKDDLESGKPEDLRTYDLLRNHLYRINILSVTNPGTPTPEDALKNVVVGLDVKIEEWESMPMRGIPDQYTLTTSTSVISFADLASDGNLTVTTDYGQELGQQGNGEWKIVEQEGTWFEAIQDADNKTIYIKATQNYGVARRGTFYVRSGNLLKQIVIEQEQPPTANCYVVGDGIHKLIVTIKGNGNKGLVAEGVAVGTDASIKPKSIGIIWETKAGLVKLKDKTNNLVGGNTPVDYNTTAGTIEYVVNTTDATIGSVAGGNALIGAFDTDGTILWSWHIWVRPNIDADRIESYDEDWTLNGYKVMDRNLGALSNSPGVASLGLLYQWGRKDPFIGAAQTNDNFVTPDGKLETKNYNYKYDNGWAVANSNDVTSIDNTIKYPTRLTYAGLSETTDLGDKRKFLWGTNGGLNTEGVKDLGSKTIYDPCPYGYRVPPVDAFVFSANVKLPNDKNWTVYDKDIVSYDKKERVAYGSKINMVGGQTYYDVFVTVAWGGSPYITNVFKEKYTLPTDRTYTGSYFQSKWKYTNCIVRKSSEDYNWNENLTYIPHFTANFTWVDADYLVKNYTGNYIEADYYGFYLNYKEIKTPTLTSEKKKGIEHYRFSNNWYTRNGDYTYKLDASNKNTTWLPLSGAYNPEKGFTFKDVVIEQGSSITVNSFLWTNSSVQSGTDWIPAAMFLHGTEKRTTATGSGRHIHGLTKSGIRAEPHYAGAVRCVRDTKKDFSESNYLEGNVAIGNAAGAIGPATLKSINDQWRVIDSGAYWLSVSPERGGPDKGKGQTITFKALEKNGTVAARKATVLIQFGNEATPRKIVVTQSQW